MSFFDDLDRQLMDPSREPPRVRARRPEDTGAAPGPSDEILRDLLRFTLYRSQDVQTLMNANALCFLVANEELQRTLKESVEAYQNKLMQQHSGDIDAARARARELKKPLDPHPWGTRKYFHLMLLCKYFQKMAQDWDEPKQQAANYLLNLTADQVDTEIAACYSKFKTPLEGRTWKFSVLFTAICRPDTRTAFATLVNAPANGIRLEPTREMQSDLERKLWSTITKK